MSEAVYAPKNLTSFLERIGVFEDRDLTQEEFDGIIKFYYSHGLDQMESIDEFFEQMK